MIPHPESPPKNIGGPSSAAYFGLVDNLVLI